MVGSVAFSETVSHWMLVSDLLLHGPGCACTAHKGNHAHAWPHMSFPSSAPWSQAPGGASLPLMAPIRVPLPHKGCVRATGRGGGMGGWYEGKKKFVFLKWACFLDLFKVFVFLRRNLVLILCGWVGGLPWAGGSTRSPPPPPCHFAAAFEMQ